MDPRAASATSAHSTQATQATNATHAALATLATGRPDCLQHVQVLPARAPQFADWPDWVDHGLRDTLGRAGIEHLWQHQARAAELAHARQHLAIATGTGSGKSMAFWLPVLSAVHDGRQAADGRGATALYLAPTKALAHDQARALQQLPIPGARVSIVDGDTPAEERAWARAHATIVLTNPDLVHASMLGGHAQWAGFLRRLRYVIIDEAHAYRGLFGAHVSQVLRRLRRVCDRYGADPTFIAASATVGEPAALLRLLAGVSAEQVTDDGSPAPARTVALWEPELMPVEAGSSHPGPDDPAMPRRRSALAEAAEILAELAGLDQQTIAFIRSRRGAEAIAAMARDQVSDGHPDAEAMAERITSYRGGYLPEERRDLEARLRSGQIIALASTSALELGIDVSGMDAVLVVGWPGTRASLWQQFGRAGRRDAPALAVFIARDDPLDAYVVRHPEAIFGAPIESIVLDPNNPAVLSPHLCAAASEFPLTDEEAVSWFGAGAPTLLAGLGTEGLLRRRPTGWFWTRRDRASDLADLRGSGAGPIAILESDTGRILGTIDTASAHTQAHTGAVYTHLGQTYLIEELDLQAGIAVALPTKVDYTTHAQEVSDVRILSEEISDRWGDGTVSFGRVDVTAQVVGYQRRKLTSGQVISQHWLDLPLRSLTTVANWWTASDAQIASAGLLPADVPGAAHAAEHASIGLLPLFATCDRWDIGGMSTAQHPDTGRMTVFVYDGATGGAGFAERGYQVARAWLSATLQTIGECTCTDGCPACIQSPKCGNGNHPLDKAGSTRLLAQLLDG
ncbi:MAG: DEAD/DEAH box helicase [Actinomycetales bacterium]